MEVAVIAMLASGASAFLAWFAHSWRSDARRTRRVLRRARVTPIAELVDGKLACVVGRVEVEGEQVTSLVTGQPCLAYETIVQVFGRIDMTVPARVDVTRKIVPFFVTDGTGRVRVDAAQAALANDPSARSERFEERVIENGVRVRVVGSVVLDPARSATGEHGFREGAWTATLTGTRRYPLLVDVEPD